MSLLQQPVPASPLWARLFRAYELHARNHPGKRTLLRLLSQPAMRRARPFVSRMANGSLLAFSPLEAGTWTAGWSAFVHRVWEPHVERCLRELLQPGDNALDIGANLGYFSAVMAQAVGPTGGVYSFEPVRSTFDRLSLCRSLNGFEQLVPFQLGLGAEDGELEIAYDPRFGGSASIYGEREAAHMRRESVLARSLDGLVASGIVPIPDLIKIDVEGHELAVLRGAAASIAKGQPAIVFELNEGLARLAGWTLPELAALVSSLGDYRYFVIRADGLERIDPTHYRADEERYAVDILARSTSR